MAKDMGKHGKKNSWNAPQKEGKHPDALKDTLGENTYPEFSAEGTHGESRGKKK